MATYSELKAQKLELARKANEERNNARLKRLEDIADSEDAHRAKKGEMQEQDGDQIVLVEAENKIDVEAAAPEPEEAPAVEAAPEPEEVVTEEVAAAPETTEEVVDETQEVTTEDSEPASDERVVNGVRYYLTIVNGKEKWLSKSQLIERAQKVESADEYLQNAAESARSITRTDPSQEDDTVTVEEDDWEKTLGSAVLGEQEAVKKIASAFSKLQKELQEAKKAQPSVTPDVVKEIDSRLAFRSAVDWFNGEYSKELADPKLKKLIFDRDQELAQSNPDMPYRARMKKAGDEVRTWINSQKGVQAKPSPEKIDRKKTIVNVPAASQRQAPPQEDDEEEDVGSVIQSLAKGRGQSRAIVYRKN